MILIIIKKAEILNKLQMTEEALLCVNKAIEIEPEAESTYFEKAKLLMDLDRINDVSKCFDAMLSSKSHFPKIYMRVAFFFEDFKMYEEAIRYYDLGIKNYPFACNIYGISSAYKAMGMIEEAKKYKEKAIEITPKLEEEFLSNANIFFFDGLLEEQSRCIDKAIELNPNNVDYYKIKVKFLRFLDGKESIMIKMCDIAIKLEPECAYFYCMRAKSYEILGKHELSVRDYKISSGLIEKGVYKNMSADDIESINYIMKDFIKSQKLLQSVDEKANSISTTEDSKTETKKIVNDFDSAFNKVLVKVTTNRLSENPEQKNKEDDPRFEKLFEQNALLMKLLDETQQKMEKIVVNSLQSEKELKSEIDSLTKKLQMVDKKLTSVEGSIEEINSKMNNLAKNFKMTKEEFEKKFNLNEQEIKKMREDYKSGIEMINSEFNEEGYIKEYALKFYFTLNDYIQAYKVSNTGLTSKNNESKAQKFFGFLSNISATECAAMLIEKVISYYGQVPSFEEKSKAITEISHKAEATTGKDLNKVIAFTVIAITNLKKEALAKSNLEFLNADSAGMFVKNEVENLKQSFEGDINAINLSFAEELAIKDVGLFINHLIKNPKLDNFEGNSFNIKIFEKAQEEKVEVTVKEEPKRECNCLILPIRVIISNHNFRYSLSTCNKNVISLSRNIDEASKK